MNLSTGYYNAHRVNEFVRLDEVEKLIGRVKSLLQTETGRFSYSDKRVVCAAQMEWAAPQRKKLQALSNEHIVEVNHQAIADGRGYYMDESGRIYLYLNECDRMVHIHDAEAFCVDGSAAAYRAGLTKEYKTIEMEEAMRLLGQERRAG